MRETFFFKTVALGTKIAFSRLYLAYAIISDRLEIIPIYSPNKLLSIYNKILGKEVLRA